MARARPWWLLTCLALTAAADSPRAVTIEFAVDAITAQGAALEGITARLQWPAGPLVVRVEDIRPGNRSPLSHVRLDCSAFDVDANGRLSCEGGRLSFDHPLASPRAVPVSLHWDPDQGGSIELTDVPLGGKEVRATFTRQQEENWEVTVDTRTTDLAEVSALFPVANVELAGTADVHATVEIVAGGLRSINGAIQHFGTRFQDASDDFVGENLEGRINLEMEQDNGRWEGRLEARWDRGEFLTPVAYVAATAANPFAVGSRIAVADSGSRVDLEAFRVSQSPWLRIEGDAALGTGSPPLLRQLDVRMREMDAGVAFGRYLAPVLVHPVLGALEVSGRAGGRIRISDGKLSTLQLNLQDLAVRADTDTVRFAVEGLQSQVDVGHGTARRGTLQWQSARLFDFSFGATLIPLLFGDDKLATGAPVTIPLLDGALEVEQLALDWTRTPPHLTLDALLLPVSIEEVTAALGWIPMQGKLSGVIPRVAIREGALEVGGNLLVQVFDGTVVIRNLRISDLFGYWPVLTADADISRLDLEMLTGTYEFGRITGRVDGVVEGLRLENWRPVAFDARFETTPGDRTRRRISQRAVDNLTSLSGGASGALSRTFLRVFDEFNYDRLGIACRLHNGVCRMDGVETAERGYYLVKGGGIPRIDVIGFNRSIDWELLVDRLIAVTASGPPIIE